MRLAKSPANLFDQRGQALEGKGIRHTESIKDQTHLVSSNYKWNRERSSFLER